MAKRICHFCGKLEILFRCQLCDKSFYSDHIEPWRHNCSRVNEEYLRRLQTVSNQEAWKMFAESYRDIVLKDRGRKIRKPKSRRATAIVEFRRGILLVSHSKGKRPTYMLPGGRIRKKEESVDALKRELYEETGLHASEVRYIFNHITKHNIHEVFLVKAYGRLRKRHEITHIRFYSDRAKGRLKLAKHVKPIIDRFRGREVRASLRTGFEYLFSGLPSEGARIQIDEWKCAVCGDETYLYRCPACGGLFCAKHKDFYKHDCPEKLNKEEPEVETSFLRCPKCGVLYHKGHDHVCQLKVMEALLSSKKPSKRKRSSKKYVFVGMIVVLLIAGLSYVYVPEFQEYADDVWEDVKDKYREWEEKRGGRSRDTTSTPIPTSIPTPSPTVTSTPSPTPTPIPTPTPTPTPINTINESKQIDPMTGRYSPYIDGIQYHYYLGLVKTSKGVVANSYGDFIVLINNRDAKDPTYSQLLDFLKLDQTDQYPYGLNRTILLVPYFGSAEDNVDLDLVKEIIDGTEQASSPRICADFAVMLHNNAEKVGIRCGYVSIELSEGSHALNVFNTTDRGLVYIDDTGTIGDYGPSNCDKIVNIKIGRSYIPKSLFPEKSWSSTWGNMGTVVDFYTTWDGEWN